MQGALAADARDKCVFAYSMRVKNADYANKKSSRSIDVVQEIALFLPPPSVLCMECGACTCDLAKGVDYVYYSDNIRRGVVIAFEPEMLCWLTVLLIQCVCIERSVNLVSTLLYDSHYVQWRQAWSELRVQHCLPTSVAAAPSGHISPRIRQCV